MPFAGGRFSWRAHRDRWLVVLVLLAGAVPCLASAAPYPGVGEAPVVGSDGASGQKDAIARARRAALEAALETIEGPLDPAARARMLANPELWTSAFRILRADDDGATLRVEIEADIDLQRLTKELRPKTVEPVRPESVAYRLGRVDVRDCPEDRELFRHVEAELARRGIVGPSGKSPLTAEVHCRVVGPVPHSELHAVRLDLDITSPGAQRRIEGTGVAETAGAAALIALDRAVDSVSARLRGAQGDGIVLKFEAGAPAGLVRRYVRQVERSVMGVGEISLDGVDPDGAIRFEVHADVGVRELARRLQALPPADVPVTLVAVAEPNLVVIHVD